MRDESNPGTAAGGGGPTVKRTEGPTPAGGAYALAMYDGEGQLLEIVEYDEADHPIARTYPMQDEEER